MLNRLSVGKKMGLGFGVIIVILIALMAINAITSLAREQDLNAVSKMSQLQAEKSKLVVSFYAAQDDANAVFTQLDTEEVFQSCMKNIEASLGYLEQMQVISAELDGYQSEAISSMQENVAAWKRSIEDVQRVNDELNITRTALIASSKSLAATSSELYELISSLAIREAANDTVEQIIYRINDIVLPSVYLSETVDAMRVESSYLILTFDVSVTSNIYKTLSELEEGYAQMYGIVSQDASREAISSMQQSIKDYRDGVGLYESAILATGLQVEAATSSMNNVVTLMSNFTSDIDAETNTYIQNTIQSANRINIVMITVAVVAVVLSVLIGVVLVRNITKPLNQMAVLLTQVGETGNLDFSQEVVERVEKYAEAKDEVGKSLRAFISTLQRLIYVGEALHEVAGGDLTHEVELLSNADSMGNSLKNMSNQLNNMFSEINNVAEQVTASAAQISTGAQALASGATEQAATVEEISSSIASITEQTNISASEAKNVATDGIAIRESAMEGNESMREMMLAMQNINEASQAIGQVIKVIDDIAFQTNILALNAAVEAARAGAHGKGFAVVAEEVRNLASKSADAAKQTSQLISANIDKAKLGLSISERTSASLTSIMTKVQKTTDALETVVEQSESISLATAQVNTAVEQVAQVVQQNSATSEQSAAASEEMSAQAQALQMLLSRFRLRAEQ